MSWAILTHGGAASDSTHADGCQRAAEHARGVIEQGGDALYAAIEATRVLEDDARFNAGTGSNLRLDGCTVQMDASLMTSDGCFGAVACIERVRNPILVAAKVMESPHSMLVGEGATALARRMGLPDYDPTTEAALAKHRRALAELGGRGDGRYADDARAWRGVRLEELWNFETPMPEELKGTRLPSDGPGTVGAVVRDGAGRFCATASTGGTLYMLRGRVGDSPLLGAGVFAGPQGAVACTGVGEEIARRVLSKTVYDWLASGTSAREAAERAVAQFPEAIDVGVLVASSTTVAIAANRSMAQAMLEG